MLTLLIAGCSDTRVLEGTVADIWGRPVADASIVIEGVVERFRTDGGGKFSLEPTAEVKRVMAGKQGFIKAVLEVTPPRDSEAHFDPLAFSLYPEPEQPGFYAVGEAEYIPVVAQRIRVVATELRHYAGVRDLPDQAMATGLGRFVFTSMLRESELARMNLHLSRLTFVATARVKGILGPVKATVNLWTADSDVPFDITSFGTRDDYLIVTREPLEFGVYAFHAQDVLNEVDERVLQNLPREMQVAFPFEVNG